jgi:hypothetical protein
MQPFTVKHRFANGQLWDGDDVASAPPLETCDKSGPMVFENIGSKQEVSVGRVLFTCVSAATRRAQPHPLPPAGLRCALRAGPTRNTARHATSVGCAARAAGASPALLLPPRLGTHALAWLRRGCALSL